jgi:hypothetical protein
MLTNQNLFPVEIKSRLNLGIAYYHSFQNLLSSGLLSKNITIKPYTAIIFLVVLYGCEIRSLTFGKEYQLRVFQNRVLKRIFGSKKN